MVSSFSCTHLIPLISSGNRETRSQPRFRDCQVGISDIRILQCCFLGLLRRKWSGLLVCCGKPVAATVLVVIILTGMLGGSGGYYDWYDRNGMAMPQDSGVRVRLHRAILSGLLLVILRIEAFLWATCCSSPCPLRSVPSPDRSPAACLAAAIQSRMASSERALMRWVASPSLRRSSPNPNSSCHHCSSASPCAFLPWQGSRAESLDRGITGQRNRQRSSLTFLGSA